MKLDKREITIKDGNSIVKETYVPEQKQHNSITCCVVCLVITVTLIVIGLLMG